MTSLNAQLKAIGPKQRQRSEGQREGRKGERGEGRDGKKKGKGVEGRGGRGGRGGKGRKEKMQFHIQGHGWFTEERSSSLLHV